MLIKASIAGSSVIPFRPDRFKHNVIALGVLFAITSVALLPLLALWEGIALCVSLPFLIVAAASDLVTREIPDICSVGLAIVAVICLRYQPWPEANLVCALAVLAVFWGGSSLYFRLRGHEALGLGDVKLLSAAALLLGPVGFWLLLLIAPVGGIVFALIGRKRRDLPFAPFISYGVILALPWAARLNGGTGA
ncbi:MAG: prepilin peptidase [Paracoccaceae bacterium]